MRERQHIVRLIARILETKPGIGFAYIYGSFASGEPFRDIDLAVHLSDVTGKDSIRYEIRLETELEDVLGFPVDVRALNMAPLSFRYSVFRHGRLILENEPTKRVEFQARSVKEYLDFAPVRRRCFGGEPVT
ncbi:MAG: nucleotidyltransferase domain-containing protein [Bacillota bacterium]